MSKLHNVMGDTYKVIKGYLNREEAIQLAENFKVRAEEKSLGNAAAGFVENCVSEYNCPELLAVLCEKTTFLNELLGEKVIPTYSFTRMSYTGSVLPRHTDRPTCEVSLSIHLWGDTPWAFGIVDSEGNDVEIILEPGDAILYDACNAEHFRAAYTGECYIQTFHHYVYLNGELSSNGFDSGVRGLLDVRNYIKHYPKAFPTDFCKDIINYVSSPTNRDRWKRSDVIGDYKEMRTCSEIQILPNRDTHIDNLIYYYVKKYIGIYSDDVNFFNCKQDSGYTILRYEVGNEFQYHCDHCLEYNRASTMIINLNDDYVGGQLNFTEDLVTYDLGAGDIMIFPSSYVYPHKIRPITKGIRYSIVTWLA